MAWLSTTLLPGCLSAIIQAGPGFEVVFNYIFAYRDDRRHVLSRADVVGQSYGSQLSRCPHPRLTFSLLVGPCTLGRVFLLRCKYRN